MSEVKGFSARSSVGLVVLLMLSWVLPTAGWAEISIVKYTNGQDANTPPGPVLTVGAPVTWTYLVTAGSRDASDIVVTDDQGVAVSCPASTLAATESMTCSAVGVAVAGQYTNLGTVSATEGSVQASDSDPSHYFGVPAGLLSLQKSTNGQDADLPPGPVLAIGAAVNWTYLVSNTSGDTLTEVVVVDDQGVTVTCPTDTLASGASMLCTASGTAQAGQYANLGIVTAVHPIVGALAATDPSHYFGQANDLDFGDAPDGYGTSFAGDGPRHLTGSGVYLGACVDAELDGAPSATADADDLAAGSVTVGTCAVAGDDEDGVTFDTQLLVGRTADLTVTANAPCTLSAWIDFEGDGSFLEAADAIFPGGLALVAGANPMSFTVPTGAQPGGTFARFRCTSFGAVGPQGAARDGEVEDYGIEIVALAQLSIDKVASPDPVQAGRELTYQITVTNAGPSDAQAVVVLDSIPAYTSFLSLTAPAGWSCTTPPVGGAGTVDCSLPTLPPGTASFTLVVAVDLVGIGPQLENTASVSSATLDLEPADNSVTVTTRTRSVVPIPALGMGGLLALGMALAAVGFAMVRRQRTRFGEGR